MSSSARPADRPRRVSRLVRLLAAAVIVLLCLGAAEAGFLAYYTLRDGRFIPVSERLSHQANTFVGQLPTQAGDCRYVDTLFPHPWLAHVHHANPPCGLTTVNNVGLFGREFPARRDAGVWTVLLTGGSVASQLGQTYADGPLFLELELNHCYRPPHGDRFVVLNGADGAWSQPQPAIMGLLYGEIADAIVTVGGFNELANLPSNGRLDRPSQNFLWVNPFATGSYEGLASAYLASRLTQGARAVPVLGHSHLAYFFVDRARGWLIRRTEQFRDAPPRTSYETLFAYPASWSPDQRLANNRELFKKYVRATAALARAYGARAAFFLQPVPHLKKQLTEEETAVAGVPWYRDYYQSVETDLLSLRDEGLVVVSLTDLLENQPGSYYADSVHFRFDASHDSPGYRLMARTVAREMAAAFGFERTCAD